MTGTVSARWGPGTGKRLTHEHPSYVDVMMNLRGMRPGPASVAVTLTSMGALTDAQRGGVPALIAGFDPDDGLWLPTVPGMRAAVDTMVNGGGLVGEIMCAADLMADADEFVRLRVVRDPGAAGDTLAAPLALLRITVSYRDAADG